MDTRKMTRIAMLLTLGLALSYFESLIPFNFSVPGIKLGLANMVTMFVLYRYETKDAVLIMFLRVLISGFMFSGLNTIIFGIFGGIFCITVMKVIKRFDFFSVVGVSILGAVFHNIGQLAAAFIIMQNTNIIYYLPYLLISGIVSGFFIGYISAILIKRFQNI